VGSDSFVSDGASVGHVMPSGGVLRCLLQLGFAINIVRALLFERKRKNCNQFVCKALYSRSTTHLFGYDMDCLVLRIIRLEAFLAAVVNRRQTKLHTFRTRQPFRDYVGAVRRCAGSSCRHGWV
jgi:hypothetical protein